MIVRHKMFDLLNDKQNYQIIRNNPLEELNNEINKISDDLVKYNYIDQTELILIIII